MLEKFNKNATGSAYSLGNTNASAKVVMLHGNGSSAHLIRHAGDILSHKIPDAEIIIPNGSYTFDIPMHELPEDMRQQVEALNHTPFTWYPQNSSQAKHTSDPLSERLASLQQNTENRIYLLGFSIGGFRAADIFLNAPDDFAGAVLHSSGIVDVPKIKRLNTSAKKPRILTQMGLKDPYLRSKFALAMLPCHFFNQWKVNRAGIGAKSVFHRGLCHEMTEKSLSRSAQHILDLEAR
ncbi:MAG: hypothetical protein CMH27_05635 [Micavibrio sp.]|nr:hypothetical protein [Micavibrio sp.]|tara:strand:- start:482 stop:1192 length:711 start_codon:yes stop_codon:yes gene_type:complete